MATTTPRARARHARAPGAALLTSALLVGGAAFPVASAPEASEFGAIDAHVRSAMEASAIPGVAYGIVRDGAVVHLAAFGSAAADGRPMTVQTPMLIGSVGKSITALAVRQLANAGLIELDAPVTRYLPWFTLADAVSTGAVTIDSLLRHTSGLSTWDGQDADRYAPSRTAEDLVRGLGLASGHRYLFGVPVPYVKPFPTGMVAAGYHVSTAEDMARFTAALSDGACTKVQTSSGRRTPARARTARIGSRLRPRRGPHPAKAERRLPSTPISSPCRPSASARSSSPTPTPTQVLGLPAGAADIALDVLRLAQGQQPAAAPPRRRRCGRCT